MLCSLECANSSLCAAWSLDLNAGKCLFTSAIPDTTPKVSGPDWMWAPRCHSGDHFFRLISPPGVFSSAYERNVKRSQLLTILPRLGRQFKLSYEFKITEYGYTSYYYYAAVHMSTGSNTGSYGSRMPYVAYYGTKVKVYAAISGEENSVKSFPRSLKNEWTTIEISQQKKDGVYMYTVSIDGEEVHAEANKGPAVFSNMKVYASDPWNSVQQGVIRNIAIQTSDTTISKTISNHQLSPEKCPEGYRYLPGGISGTNIDYSSQPTSSEECKERCDQTACCNSFKWSPSYVRCYLYKKSQPTTSSSSGDYLFCGTTGSSHCK